MIFLYTDWTSTMTLPRYDRRFAAGLLAAAVASWAFPSGAVAAGGTELVMFEQAGCVYCRRWHEDVAPEYPLTAEGRAAPLRVVDLHTPLPADIALARPVSFTPTFVLLRDGTEVGRLEGYPGEDFFWGLLQQMLAKNGAIVN